MVRHRLPHGAALALLMLTLAGCQKPQVSGLSLDNRLRLAETMDAQGGGTASLGVLREAAAQRPTDAALREKLAIAAEREGLYAEAAQAMRDATALGGATLPRLLAIGRLELRAGNPATAVEAYAQAQRVAPRSAAALGGQALARDLAGDQAGALENYRGALALAPQDWTLRGNYGLSQVLAGRPRDAAATLADAEFSPAAPRGARHNLALALAASGQRDRVLKLLRLDMGPTEAAAMAQEFDAVAARLPVAEAAPRPVAERVARAETR